MSLVINSNTLVTASPGSASATRFEKIPRHPRTTMG